MPPDRGNRAPSDDNYARFVHPGGQCAHNAPQLCDSATPPSETEKEDPVGDISAGSPWINLETRSPSGAKGSVVVLVTGGFTQADG